MAAIAFGLTMPEGCCRHYMLLIVAAVDVGKCLAHLAAVAVFNANKKYFLFHLFNFSVHTNCCK